MPQLLDHRIDRREVPSGTERIETVEAQSLRFGQQPPAERALKQCQTHQRLFKRCFRCVEAFL